jgi:hypothetical protein
VRKSLRKRAEKRFPGHPLAWIGGVLYFSDSGRQVPEIPKMPKPKTEAIGWHASRKP